MLIYCVTNTVNSKVYIGKWAHPTIDHRWRLHKSAAKNGSPYFFHRAIRKYGVGSFEIKVIDKASTPEELSNLEKHYISLYQSNDHNKGYNMTTGGEGTPGWVPSEAWRKWKSGHSKRLWSDPEYRTKQKQGLDAWWTDERKNLQAEQVRAQRALGIDPRSRPVRCLDTGEVFSSVQQAVQSLGLKKGCNLSLAIRHGRKFHEKVWEYVNP